MNHGESKPALGRVRDLPGWARNGSVLVRAVHLSACAGVLGSFLFGAAGQGSGPWWIAAAVSGLLLLGYEKSAHPDLLRQLSGWLTLAKLLLLVAARLIPAAATALLLSIFLLASIGAHLPKRWRHRMMV